MYGGPAKDSIKLPVCHKTLLAHMALLTLMFRSDGRGPRVAGWICCKVFSFSRSNSKLAAFQLPSKWVEAAWPDEVQLPPKSRGSWAFCHFPGGKRGQMLQFLFHFGQNLSTCPHHWTLRNFTERSGSWIFVRLIRLHLLIFLLPRYSE